MDYSQLFLKHLELTKEYKDPLLILNEPIYKLLYDNVTRIKTLEQFIYAYYIQSEEKYSGYLTLDQFTSHYFFDFDFNCIFQLFKIVCTSDIIYVYKLFITPLLLKILDVSPLSLNIFKCVSSTYETDFVMPYVSSECNFSSNRFRIQDVIFEQETVLIQDQIYHIKSIHEYHEHIDLLSIIGSIQKPLTKIVCSSGKKIFHYQCPLLMDYYRKQHETEYLDDAIRMLWPALKRPLIHDIIQLKQKKIYFPKILLLILIFICIFCCSFIIISQSL